MESSSPEPKEKPLTPAGKPQQVPRVQIGTNVVTQFVLAIFILGLINFVAFNYYKRWDLSRDAKFSLSEQTRMVLSGLKETLSIYVIVPNEGFPMFSEVESLLKEYEYAGRPNVKTYFIDTYKDITRTSELQAQFQFDKSESVIVVAYGGRSKVISGDDLYNLDANSALMGEQPSVTDFLGEQKITSAMIEVTEDRQPKVYATEGHKEPMFVADPPMGLFLAYLERDNILMEPVNLATVDQVPTDASMIVVMAPQFDFSEREIGLLNDYWERGGRILMALDPNGTTPRLNAFLATRGVKPNGDRIMRTFEMGPVTGILRDIPSNFIQGSPITSKLIGASTQLFGGTQSLGVNREQEKAGGLQIKSLLESPKEFWGETLHENAEKDGVYFDITDDFEGPLTIAASVEKAGVEDPRVQIGGPRLVVIGNGKLFDEESTNEPNVMFGLSAFNWLLDREAMIGVPPKAMRNFTLKLTSEQQTTIFIVAIIAIPGLALMAGIFVWWTRRS